MFQSSIGLIAASHLDDPDDRSYVVLSYLSTDAVYSDDDQLIEFTETRDQINNQRQGIGANTARIIGILTIFSTFSRLFKFNATEFCWLNKCHLIDQIWILSIVFTFLVHSITFC